VARAFNGVLQLTDPPTALVRPQTVVRVLTQARHSPVATAAAIEHPRIGSGAS
jgi:hypothetical protein